MMLLRNGHDHARLINSRVEWKEAVYDGYNGRFNIASNPYLSITGCEFIGDRVFLGDARQVLIRDCVFLQTDFSHGAIVS